MMLFAPGEVFPQQSAHWFECRDGEPTAMALFRRHYSCTNKAPGQPKFAGPGAHIILLTHAGDALFVWREERYRLDGQAGVCCAVFRNEGPLLSSLLIGEAEEIAREKWGDVRLFTFIDPRRIASVNPGYCFSKAGWRKCGRSQGGLLILERL